MKIRFKNGYVVEVADEDIRHLDRKIVRRRASDAVRALRHSKKLEDSAPVVEDKVPMEGFGSSTKITHGESKTTVSSLKSPKSGKFYKDLSDEEFIDVLKEIMESLEEDIGKIRELKGSKTMEEKKALIREYNEVKDMALEKGFEKEAEAMIENIKKLENGLHTFKWKEPEFTEEDKVYESDVYEKEKEITDSEIKTEVKPNLAISAAELKKAYVDAKRGQEDGSGKFQSTFEKALEKVFEDLDYDVEMIKKGQYSYKSNVPLDALKKTLEHYENGLKYAEDLGYEEEAKDIESKIGLLKEEWFAE